MSSLTILGDTSGSIALTAATVAGSTAITIAAQSGTLNVGGPAFFAYAGNSQNVATNTATKIQLTSERFDTANAFDSTTNYRFQPTVAGYYQISASLAFALATNNIAIYVNLYLNGTSIAATSGVSTSASYPLGSVSALLYLNGSTDYVELWGQQKSGGTTNVAGNFGATGDGAYMTGFLARTA
jgi:hypothetical protein